MVESAEGVAVDMLRESVASTQAVMECGDFYTIIFMIFVLMIKQ